MRRRSFIGLAAAGTVAAAVPSAVWASAPKSNALLSAEPDLLHVIRNPETIHRIGTLYRRAHPSEDDANALRGLIVGRSAETYRGAGLRAAIEGKVRDDFRSGRTVRLDGWVLARTEARHCALFSLERSI